MIGEAVSKLDVAYFGNNIMIDSLSPDLVFCTQAIYSHGGEKTRGLQSNKDGEID